MCTVACVCLRLFLSRSLYPCPHYTCLALMLPFAGTSFAILLSLQLHRSLGRPLFSLRLCSALGPLLRGNNNSELRLVLELLAGSLAHGGHYSCSYPAWGGRKASDSVLWRSSRWFWGTTAMCLHCGLSQCVAALWAAPAWQQPHMQERGCNSAVYDLKMILFRRFCSFSASPLLFDAAFWNALFAKRIRWKCKDSD